MALSDSIKTAVLVLVAFLGLSLWVNTRVHQAVERAKTAQQLDSLKAVHKADSLAWAAKDSANRVLLASYTAHEHTLRIRVDSATQSVHAAQVRLDSAQTTRDSIGALASVVSAQGEKIKTLTDALAVSDSINRVHEATEADLRASLASLNAQNAKLIHMNEEASRRSVWNSSAWRLGEALLAVKGALDIYRGH